MAGEGLVDYEMLKNLFHLDHQQDEAARNILKMSQANQRAAIVYGIISLQSNQSSVSALPPVDHSSGLGSSVIHLDRSQNFVFSDLIRDNIKNFIRQSIMECKPETYSLQYESDNGAIINGSLVRLTTQHVSRLTSQLKNDHLPPGFETRDPQAVKLVDRFVHELVKLEKGTLRGCLLKNVVPNSVNRLIRGNVPSINQLYSHIQHHLPHSGEASNESQVATQVLVRFAYMRLETILFAKSGSKARAAQWGPIDKQLMFVKDKGADYYLSWAELILQNDRYFFGSGDRAFDQVPTDRPILPLVAEVQDLIRSNAQDRRSRNGV